jgi:hypothetical protein
VSQMYVGHVLMYATSTEWAPFLSVFSGELFIDWMDCQVDLHHVLGLRAFSNIKSIRF